MNKNILKLSFAFVSVILLVASCTTDPNSGIFEDKSASEPSPYASTQPAIYTTPNSYSLKDTLAKYNSPVQDSTK
ncbi:MAG: hypothetical protein KKE39_06715 [Bacteroidetes bacterium]|nr:hypothetical protein [Bacteroidota bacterium]MBU1372882.1 hypothetical protein [Bacteroidota bacterium]MBU1485611.1 hypothetical protein [Bacteroidota bacterium]MBU1761438.1 hypothetical protein [Bacteroidota bacterium]MBU2268902.1 hypothetical protein [Bacteroidota bacterium]